jgi:class 3 adenylate cyclase
MTEREQLEQAIAHLETQRAALGDAVVDVAVVALEQRLAALLLSNGSRQQHQRVTVLSADFSGFTAWSEALDAEEVTELVNTVWTRLDRIILAHGGTIDIHLGDGIIALWGDSASREDDAAQAVRAALAMQEDLGAVNAERGGSPLQMRIGVHRGVAMLGNGSKTGHFAAGGDAVQIAMRLQESAPPGAVVISEDLYRQLAGIFPTLPHKPDPVPAFVVVAASTQTSGLRVNEHALVRPRRPPAGKKTSPLR